MNRQETIDAIVEAARRYPLPVVPSIANKGMFCLFSSEGTYVGTACRTREEAEQKQNAAIQHQCDEFRAELNKMDEPDLARQAAYWLKQGAAANQPPKTNTMNKTTIRMTKTKDCKGSVRFDAPKTEPGKTPNAIDNVYVSRAVPGINEAQSVTVTIEIP